MRKEKPHSGERATVIDWAEGQTIRPVRNPQEIPLHDVEDHVVPNPTNPKNKRNKKLEPTGATTKNQNQIS